LGRENFRQLSAEKCNHATLLVHRGRARQFDPKATAHSYGRFQPNGAIHLLDVGFDDGQPDACARIFMLRMKPLENAEDSSAMFGSNANPVIFDAKTNSLPFAFRKDPDSRSNPRSDKLQRVRN